MPTVTAQALPVERLTREAFAPFGDVIETAGAQHYAINNGTTERFHDLALVDVASQGGRPLINIFRGQPFECPIPIKMMERHPLGTQAFIPLSTRPFIIVVAASDENDTPYDFRAFLSLSGQGISYGRNVWHHPLLSLEGVSEFLIVDRGGEGDNLQEHHLQEPCRSIEQLPEFG